MIAVAIIALIIILAWAVASYLLSDSFAESEEDRHRREMEQWRQSNDKT